MAESDAKPKADPARTRVMVEWKHDSPLMACRFDPTGRFLLASAQDNSLQRWELEGGTKTGLVGHQSWVRAFDFIPDGSALVAGDYHGKLLWWPYAEAAPKPLRSLDAHDGWIRAVRVSPDGRLIATCGNDHLVKLWDAVEGKLVQTLMGHTRHVYNVAFHPNGKELVSGDLLGVIKHWDLDKGSVVRELDAKPLHKYDETFRADIGGIRSFAFSPDARLLAAGGITDVTNAFAGIGKPLILLFDWEAGKVRLQLRPKENFQGVVWGIVYHPDNFLAAAGAGAGGALWFWKPDQAQDIHMLKLPNNSRDLALHRDGLRLAVPFYDGSIKIYTMAATS
ncbi:MAG: WD40 repeat domain-containing protein [Gemmataceae bacterium]|nr:WD40 repeat domain-containing protein [Gemmataceae bacterium]MDW8264111.1 WD40 repeat domain-containing protein [Gemmataceae bacterium]